MVIKRQFNMDVIVNAIKEELPANSKSLQNNYYSSILHCLGYEREQIPLGNLLKLYHQLEGDWLIASPVHWEASHNDAVLSAAFNELELSEDESRLWFFEVADFLKPDGFSPVFHDAHLWLFKIDNKPNICSQSLNTLLHQSLMPVFSSLDTSHYWQRLITEMQMYLSAHPLNLKRQGLPINGLWFWGEGAFVPKGRTIVTDDQILLSNYSAIKPLMPTTFFNKEDLIIIHDPKEIERCGLMEKIKNNTVNWYWSNCSYTNQKKSWWSKIWG